MKVVVSLIVLCYIASTQTQVSPSCKGFMGLIHFNDDTEPKTATDPSETATEEEKVTVLIENETGFYEIDFDDENSLDEFEPCYFQGPSNLFKIKSYSDVSVEPYRNNSENHLGNTGAGFSCIKTKKSFELNTNTKIEFAIFLNSNSQDDSYVEFLAYQEEEILTQQKLTQQKLTQEKLTQEKLTQQKLTQQKHDKTETDTTETDTTETQTTETETTEPDTTEPDTTEQTDQTETDPTEKTDPTVKTDPTDEATDPAEEETDTTEPKTCIYETDFNDLASLDEFEPCDYPPEYRLHLFGIKSYADAPLEPYRSDADNYLSNLGVGYSCLRTTQSFNFETNSELHCAIYLNASLDDLLSYVAIKAVLPDGFEQTLTSVRDRWSNNWNLINDRISISDAKIQIEAGSHSADVLIAIEYIRIVYPCTTTTTTINTTGNQTNPPTDTTTRPPRISPYPQNSNIIWIIMSFSFFLTTIVVSVALFCLVYMYMAATAKRRNPSMISFKQATALPRLAVAYRTDGDTVIVGIGNDVANKPKFL
ncbi:hypothetical protein HA402_000488 [Bradysia odoriphaga]|nr:hypothetical protein HA402_000488 [Bradysia odoriphaga]